MTEWWRQAARPVDTDMQDRALERQSRLTKPAGSLGQLEALAVRLAGLQGSPTPRLDRVAILVFAADHGVAAEQVSAYPQSVTGEMVRNFSRGGAAINVLARALGAELTVTDVGTAAPPAELNGVVSRPVAAGTANFVAQAAMTGAQRDQAMHIGAQSAETSVERGTQLVIGGEMGIANTSAATAMACALLGRAAGELVGPGTGVNAAGLQRKTRTLEQALAKHALAPGQTLDILRCLGGFEIAALVGAFVRAAQCGVPILVDGYIAGVAALVAVRLNATLAPWLLYAHRSAEPGHRHVLQALDAHPLLDLGLRLGEGSGAALAVPILRQALALHNDMATFEDAGISGPRT